MPPPSTPRPTPTTPIEIPLPPTEVGPTPTPIPPLTERIKATLDSNRYDAIARVKVISNERVTIIPYEKIFVADWTRSTLEIVETLRGELPEEVEVASPTGAANGALDIGGYYVAFLFKGVVDASIKQFEGQQTTSLGRG
jgi:hypothetical protein